ncbi:LLM class flavin-dependent oxidoreductase [Streptomyces sp. NPDC056696]|uniref:LLM class flavin-dependent oxidoreductase n=1 Tax=unclassified Streptomyces TaxID=2593676 RepID=UPI0036BAFB0E
MHGELKRDARVVWTTPPSAGPTGTAPRAAGRRQSQRPRPGLDVAGRPDAITQLAALAAVTRRIGLVSTSNSTFNEPADLARRLSGLDLLSEGRAGWNVVTTDNAWTGANFRRGGYLDHAERYRRAQEFLTVARALWDGWEDGAVAGSAGAPTWSTPGAVHPVRHHGPQFDVDLAPTLPRIRQGHPVIFQAGDSGEGRDFAARNADVIFSAHGNDFDDALAFAADLRNRLGGPGEEALDPAPTGHPCHGLGDRRAAVGHRPVRPRRRRAAAQGGSGRRRERRLLRRTAHRRPTGSRGRMAGEGEGARLVAARDRHRARPAARARRHPVRPGR